MKPTILERIFDAKKLSVEKRRANTDLPLLRDAALQRRKPDKDHRLRRALSGKGINIIAEIKRASPSKGVINNNVNAAATARAYERGGARAISVLTEEDHFNGSLDDLRAVRGAVNLPVLQKDFIFDEFQIYEAAAAGADAVLLIAAMLDDETLKYLHRVAEEDLEIDALVEVHNQTELARAKSIGARLIGINNRNLSTFEVSLDISRELIGSAPEGAVTVAESGISGRDDIIGLKKLGFNGFLIGETLMTAADPETELRGLLAI